MKSKWKGALIGGIIGLILAVLKILLGGAGTLQVSSFYDGIVNLIFFPLFSVLFFIIIGHKKKKISKSYFLFIYFLIILSITLIQNISPILFGSKKISFLAILIPNFLFYFIFFTIIFFILNLLFWILLFIFNRKTQFKNILFVGLFWLFYCGIFFGDWTENINIGGPNGIWYLYGDLALIGGLILIFIGVLLKNKDENKNEK